MSSSIPLSEDWVEEPTPFDADPEFGEVCEWFLRQRRAGTIRPGKRLTVEPFAEHVNDRLVPGSGSDEPGRNHPCPCGSGRKYKKCCIR
jgi:hypothetical protein